LYGIFKHAHQEGTIKEFERWYQGVEKIQFSLQSCPWCNVRPMLGVHAKTNDYPEDDLRHQVLKTPGMLLNYSIECKNLGCEIRPKSFHYQTPEEAERIWRYRARD